MEQIILPFDSMSGYGYGYGYGYGDGDGDGDGDGFGDGDGDGYGYGYGDGDGFGDGFGDQEASKCYWSAVVDQFSAGAFVWCSDSQGRPANGGSKTKSAPGLIEEIAGPLEICTARALHATLNPSKWKGDRLWVVKLYPPFVEAEDKFGALKREIIGEIPLGKCGSWESVLGK